MGDDLTHSLHTMNLKKNPGAEKGDDILPPLTPSEFNLIILRVMDHMDRNAYKMMRLLNKACNETFKVSKNFNRFCYTIDGEQNLVNLSNNSVQTLIGSAMRWPKIIFKNIDLESELFGKMRSFDKFMNTNANTIKTLKFENCRMTFPRLVEVLAWMTSLDNLSIVNCPGFFVVNHTILNFSSLLPHFGSTLNELKSLTLRGRMLSSEIILSLLREASQLVSIDLQSSNHPLPAIQLICPNRNTLRSLTLSGLFFADDSAVISLSQLRLQYLALEGLEIQNTLKFGTYFLGKQVYLRKLILKNIVVDFDLFVDVNKLTCIKSLFLSNCEYKRINDYKALVGFVGVYSLEEIFLTNTFGYKVGVGRELVILFEYPRENVKRVRLTGEDLVSITILKNLPTNFQYLKVLELHSGKLRGFILEHVWKLKRLTKLVMRLCQLSDSELKNAPVNLGSLSLCDLRMLKHLDLSFNNIGDETISNQVIHLPELKELILSGTKHRNKQVLPPQFAEGPIPRADLEVLSLYTNRSAMCSSPSHLLFWQAK